MQGDICLPDRSHIARELLQYLGKHPDAEDTVEGVLQNWLVDGKGRFTLTIVQEVVKDLVLEGKLQENKVPGAAPSYRLNPARRNRIS
jgi:hypothetical protein